MASIKIKFRKSTIRNKEGVLYFQLIHNRKTKLITSRFRLHPHEWNQRLSTVIMGNANSERYVYLQNTEEGLKSEVQQIYDLIGILEKRSSYTVQELVEYYVSHSFNGYFFPFIKHLIDKLETERRSKTSSIYKTAQRSFSQGKRILIY